MTYEKLVVVVKTWEFRNNKNVTLEELSSITGISTSTLNNIENHKTEPKIGQLVKIAKALEVEVNELYYIKYK